MPFVIDYRPVYVGLGSIGGYLAAALGLSYYARRRIGGKRWRNLHRATPVVYVLGLIHTLVRTPTPARPGCARSCSPPPFRRPCCSSRGSARGSRRAAPRPR